MRNKENIKELLDYFQTTAGNDVQFDEDAIVSAYQKDDDNQSLAIKILSVFGGILASFAFAGFVFIAGLHNSKIGLLFFGAICIFGAIWINKTYDRIIIDTLSISSFIIGFILFGLGLDKFHLSENVISVVFILIAFLSLSVIKNYIISFVSILVINGSILTLIISNKEYNFINLYVAVLVVAITYFFLKEAKIITARKAFSKLYHPLRIALILSILSGLVILGKEGIVPLSRDYIWLSSVVIIAAIIYIQSYLFKILDIAKTQYKISICIVSFLVLFPTALSPAISGAILIILLSFLVNYKTGLVLGMVAFIYFISQYYYDLNFTLLTKSILLFSSGVLFIALYLFTHKKLTSNEKV